MEDNCVNCGHGSHLHWKAGSTACEIDGCDCKQMVYPKHEEQPRNGPQVAPGQLREQIYHAIIGEDARKDWRLYLSQIDSIARIAADIAAAQGGQVVDRDDFGEWLVRVIADYEKESRWLEFYTAQYIQEGYRKRLAAVPSAPGSERVTAVQDAFADLQLECGDAIEKVDGYAYGRLREAVAALSTEENTK